MNQDDDSAGFLSKVVRFVRHPSLSWAEIDAQPPGSAEERQALKAAIQRKRRNDKVRRTEFDFLRTVMRQQRAGHAVQDGTGDSVSSSASGQEADKHRTIEKIARIEEQMAQNWLRRQDAAESTAAPKVRISTSPPPVSGALEGGLTEPAHLQARPGTTGAAPLSIDVVAEEPTRWLQHEATEWVLKHPGIAQAAVSFANGDMPAVESTLRAVMAQEAGTAAASAAAVTLLDFYHAQGDIARFEDFAHEYAELFGADVPRWPAPPGREAAVAPLPTHPLVQRWHCPLLLDEAAVHALCDHVGSVPGPRWLDWSDLVSADVPAAHALLAAVQQWLVQPVDFRFVGSAVLRRRLKASTPSGRRENDTVWWQLRLAMLQLMQRREEFDLAALDFCVTYGVLPPDWQEPVCRFEAQDAWPEAWAPAAAPAVTETDGPLSAGGEPIQPLGTQLAGLDVLEWPAMATTLPGQETLFGPTVMAPVAAATPAVPAGRLSLRGVLTGDSDMAQALAELDRAWQAAPRQPVCAIDCRELVRLDFVAAGCLLQWTLSAMGRGVAVELVQVHRLLAAFFHVVGIDEAITVRLRQY